MRGLATPAADRASELPDDDADSSTEQQGRAPWKPESRRTGAIAVKLGMTQMWNEQGDTVPVHRTPGFSTETSELMNIHNVSADPGQPGGEREDEG